MTINRPTDAPDPIHAPSRAAVLVFLGGAVFWLLAGTLLAIITSIKLHTPGFLAATGWLTFGRVRAAHVNVMLYGWALMAGVGILLWLTTRRSRGTLRFPGLLIAAGLLGNLGVLVGTLGILAGGRTAVAWLGFPDPSPPLLAAVLVLVGVSVAVTLLDHHEPLGIPQWYTLAAVLGFPWLYTTAILLTVQKPLGGVAQAVVGAWYIDGLRGLWFAPVSLAALYALVPGLVGRPVASRRLALLGFWSLVLLAVWSGGRRLAGGPLPAWIVTVAVVAGVLLLVHVAAIAINLVPPLLARPRPSRPDPALGFLAFATVAYVAAIVIGSLGSLRSVSRLTHFTHAETALTHLELYGSFSMAMFGAVYHVLPRLTGREEPSWPIRTQFWCSAVGVLLSWAVLTAGGLAQGLALDNPKVSFDAISGRTLPFLWGRTAAGILMGLGHLIFAVLFARSLARTLREAVENLARPDPLRSQGTEAAVAGPQEGTP
ncbi:MAG: cbb3-type cytochrome c oxidase subunit I [Isosphaeraceae bacterium]